MIDRCRSGSTRPELPLGSGLLSGTRRGIDRFAARQNTVVPMHRHHRADALLTVRSTVQIRQPIVVAHDAMPRLSGAIARASG